MNYSKLKGPEKIQYLQRIKLSKSQRSRIKLFWIPALVYATQKARYSALKQASVNYLVRLIFLDEYNQSMSQMQNKIHYGRNGILTQIYLISRHQRSFSDIYIFIFIFANKIILYMITHTVSRSFPLIIFPFQLIHSYILS